MKIEEDAVVFYVKLKILVIIIQRCIIFIFLYLYCAATYYAEATIIILLSN